MHNSIIVAKHRFTTEGNKSSATLLSELLGIKIVKPHQKLLNIRRTLINLGCSVLPKYNTNKTVVYNRPEAVAIAVNKIDTFNTLKRYSIPIPIFYLEKDQAMIHLLSSQEDKLFCRLNVKSSKGREIVVSRSMEEIVDAPLYTVAVRKRYEFRVHVVSGNCILLQQKKKVGNREQQFDQLIRNHDNGYIFSNLVSGISKQTAEHITTIGISAIKAVGLDFGSVDIALDSVSGIPKVLEVNSNSGMSESLAKLYASAIENMVAMGCSY